MSAAAEAVVTEQGEWRHIRAWEGPSMGGRLVIDSAPGQGTRITAEVAR